MYSLETNETHPAIINCHVQCLNHTGTYNPALLLVKTTEAMFESFRTRSENTVDYYISFRSISSCQAPNYMMEFEYDFYARSARVDGAVIVCGVVHPHTQPECWGQSYAVITYNVDIPTTTTMPPPTTTGSNLSMEINQNIGLDDSATRIIIPILVVIIIILAVTAAIIIAVLSCKLKTANNRVLATKS